MKFSLEQIEEGMENYWGYCINCGESRECTEPDATEYPCEDCGTNTVYGAEELLIMGKCSDDPDGETE